MPHLATDHVFISYSRKDNEKVLRIVSFLKGHGIKVWLDNERLIPGTPIWEAEIEKAITRAYAIVVMLSPNSKESKWVRSEITLADNQQKKFFPLLIEGNENNAIPFRLITNQFIDCRIKETEALEALKLAISSYFEEIEAEAERKAKEEADHLAAKVQAEQKVKEENDRYIKQKDNEEHVAKETAEIDQRIKEEAERLFAQKLEEERLAKAKADEERKAKADVRRKAKAEAERKAKEEADRLAAKKVEEERIAKAQAEAERKAKEEADRLAAKKIEEGTSFKSKLDGLFGLTNKKSPDIPKPTTPATITSSSSDREKLASKESGSNSSKKSFISYSRVNKDFALRLTRELKAEGFDIWLDMLDIPPGARWDDEVERALSEAEIFIVILSPASINSENVLDEMAFAIDNGKRLLPIVVESCNIPLRLRRFQYVDFTNKSFDEGIQSTKELLQSFTPITSPTIAKNVHAPIYKGRKSFISYSRVNKDFAVKLAKELKTAGFNIWIDQLDIPPGSRWDQEIENALEESEIFIIVLSQASIASENVKDEIGYAIDNHKRFLPVLIENCNVPLRLRRFQYVDFTDKNFDKGVESTKELLKYLAEQPSVPRI